MLNIGRRWSRRMFALQNFDSNQDNLTYILFCLCDLGASFSIVANNMIALDGERGYECKRLIRFFSLLSGFDVAVAAVLIVGPRHITHAKIELRNPTTLQMHDVVSSTSTTICLIFPIFPTIFIIISSLN